MNTQLLAQQIADIYRRLKQNELKPGDVICDTPPSAFSARHWMTDLHAKADPSHEPDAAVFGRFRRHMGTILDIGAHWGYTASAMRLFGTDCPIVSFEAAGWNAETLDEFRRLDGNYDFSIGALGDTDSQKTLYCPVVNGTAITGLNCVDARLFDEVHGPQIAKLIASSIGGHIPVAETYRFQLLVNHMRSRRLDDALTSTNFLVPTKTIAAMKLDVERSEAAVLRGAAATLRLDLPFIMIEGANRDADVVGILRELGYLYADREDNQVRIIDSISMACNGYWLHPWHMDRYTAIGLVLQAAKAAA